MVTSGAQSPSSTVSAVAPQAPPSPSSQVLPPVEVRFERRLSVPVSSIALGEGSRIAVLGDVPYVGDANGLRPLPFPNALRAKPNERDEVRIFFGRDNEPRVMGARRSDAGESSVYFRHTSNGWKDGREEIGQLGGTTRGALWGVLGSADPELVCRVGSVCIIKRTSGWTTAPAGTAPRRVELLGGVLWGLDATGLANIDARGWVLAIPAPAWSEPRAFWASGKEAWVATDNALFHFRGDAWSQEPTPTSEPRAFWATGASSVWLVGKGGAAHFDGQAWRPLAIPGPLSVIRGRSDAEVWVGGDVGLFRVLP
jgi:hypothetical protein